MLTVFRGATAINDGTTAEPLRPWRCNYGLCRTSTAVAPRLRCDGGRRSAVMTILRDAMAINDGTTAIMAVSLRNHGDNGGATAVYAVQAPQWYRASGVTGVLTHNPQFERIDTHNVQFEVSHINSSYLDDNIVLSLPAPFNAFTTM